MFAFSLIRRSLKNKRGLARAASGGICPKAIAKPLNSVKKVVAERDWRVPLLALRLGGLV
jgi:hypothetical protein